MVSGRGPAMKLGYGGGFGCPLVFVMSGGIGNDKGGKKAVQVESEVRLGLGLVSAVFRPLDAFGGQLHDGGTHGVFHSHRV